jgi:membrane-associated phospholipid phosphatase
MDWLQAQDVAAFHLVNQTLTTPFLDVVMPFLSGNPFFIPAAGLLALSLIFIGGRRGRLCVFMLAFVVILGDELICKSIKAMVDRPRPFDALGGVRLLVGKGTTASFPSSHAANWFAAAVVLAVYYRRSLYLALPLAVLVSYSRTYVGVHYPSDVLAGAAFGAGYAAAMLWLLDALWQKVGLRWWPDWWRLLPSLTDPAKGHDQVPKPLADPAAYNAQSLTDQSWLHLGYALTALLFLARLGYIAAGKIDLSEDETYQWLWSKHLALSYFSKPPLIAYAQFLSTSLWGDTPFGVRFFAPVISAILSLALLRFLAREINARAAFGLLVWTLATPLLVAGSILMTIDTLSVSFWTAAVITGWRAVQRDSTPLWLWTGLWMGLGLLSKYVALVQWPCWALFFLLWPPARRQLARPGPYLALLITIVCSLPIVIWNHQHDWVTLNHLVSRGGLYQSWRPTLRFFVEFLATGSLLLNPVLFVVMVSAALTLCRKRNRHPLELFLFSMGAPLFLFYLLYTFRARVQPNWIAPAVIPLCGLAVIYSEARWRVGARQLQRWLLAAVTAGLAINLLLHDTNLIAHIIGHPLPPRSDPLRRLRGWAEMARVVGEERRAFLREGKPVFIIGEHYGTTSVVSFYLPEAKAGVPDEPLAYCRSSATPQNQFYFWPGYNSRHGQNALYVQQVPEPQPPPASLRQEFDSVSDLGMFNVSYRGRVLRRVQIFACRNLR